MTHRGEPAKRLSLRLPLRLHGPLVKAAKANQRTLNAEILYRLEQSLKA